MSSIKTRILEEVESSATDSDAAQKLITNFKSLLFHELSNSNPISWTRVNRMEEFAALTTEDFRRLSDRVNSEYLNTEHFSSIFRKCLRGISENPYQEKLEAFRGILINSAIRKDLSEEEKEYFLNLLDNLTVLHIRVLKFMMDPSRYMQTDAITGDLIEDRISGALRAAIPNISLEIIQSAFNDLYQRNLIKKMESLVSISKDGVLNISNGLMALGSTLIEFCTVPR